MTGWWHSGLEEQSSQYGVLDVPVGGIAKGDMKNYLSSIWCSALINPGKYTQFCYMNPYLRLPI